MAHEHIVIDTNKHFVIDPLSRKITHEADNPIIIQYDHNSERLTFEIPREVDGHDMSLCNVVEIHYLNIDKASSNEYPGLYEVGDLQADSIREDVVTFSWLISNNATQYVGTLHFTIRLACIADDGTVEYAWNTAIYDGIFIADGIYNSDIVATEYADILEKWRQELVLANIVKQYSPEDARAELGAASTEYVDQKIAKTLLETTAIIAATWTGNAAPYTQEVSVTGILETDRPHISPVYSHTLETALAQKEAWAMVSKAETAAGKITFTCFEDKPEVEIPIQIEVNR